MKILHISDIHIHSSISRYEEYQQAFDNIYKVIEDEKPDRIAIVGDLFHDFIESSNEAKSFAAKFLRKLTSYCKVILVPGNHDIRKRNLKRKPTPETLAELLDDKNLIYYGKSGFYEDDNIVWVNYSHLEKKIIPWVDIEHKKDINKIYIGLFHDPVQGCLLPNGNTMKTKTLSKLSIFDNNDITMLGDIHIRQHYDKNVSYAGSLIQQSFGEKPYGHGGILWEIDDNKNITYKDIDIETDWTYLNFYLEEPDYDDLDDKLFQSKYGKKNTNIKVHWKDYSSNITLENEQKLRTFIANKYSIEPESIKFKKEYLNTSIISNKQLTEKVDLSNKSEIREIMLSYLEENKYDKSQTKDLIELDDIITEKLEINSIEKNINWSIEDMWVDNFKSYESASIDWKNKNGVYLLDGDNQHGKTTLLDAICYILFGTTLATNKLGGAQREKNGDNRFINNKRNQDYCSGGMTINADGERFIVVRKTERTWNRDKTEIKSCSTTVDYFNDKISDDNKQTGEQKKDTQRKLDTIIGSFEDFIRLTMTNSENLNLLLSMDRATFIDSIIRDAGYDVFEKKLDIFKEYKKDNKDDKIVLDLNESNKKIEEFDSLIEESQSKIQVYNKEVKKIKDDIITQQELKNDEVKTLHKIDENIAELDIDELNNRIQDYRLTTENHLNKKKKNLSLMKDLKSEYDEKTLEQNHNSVRRLSDDNVDFKLKISNIENNIEKEKNIIEKIDIRVEQLKEKELESNKSRINDVQEEIEEIKKEFNNQVEQEIDKLKSEIKDYEYKVQSLQNDLENIKQNGKRIKKEIKELEEDNICPTCGREYDESHMEHKNQKISQKQEEIDELMIPVKDKMSSIKIFKSKIESIQDEIQSIKDKNYTGDLKYKYDDVAEEIQIKEVIMKNVMILCSKLENNNYEDSPQLVQKMKEGLKLKETTLIKIKESKEEIEKIHIQIRDNKDQIEKFEKTSIALEKDREEVKNWKSLYQENNEIDLKIENIKLTIENAKTKIEQYNNQLENIEKNKIIEKRIKGIDLMIKELNDNLESVQDSLEMEKNNVLIHEKDKKDLQHRIDKWKEQIKKEELYKEYNRIISRDGLPTYLLKQSINLINAELDNYLTEVDFTVYFDENLKLKLSPKNRLDVSQNALESSGKERTFIALALKMALRSVNNKPKTNFMMMDEVMGKLKENSVDEFMEFLNTIKSKIDKILIIEPNHSVNYDYLINVTKNKKGISSLTLS